MSICCNLQQKHTQHSKMKRSKSESSSSSFNTNPKTFATKDRQPKGTEDLYQPLVNAILGSGGFGSVNVWYHHSKYFLCAAKRFKKDDDFKSERDAILGLKHENVLRLVTFYDEERTLIFNMYTRSLEELLNQLDNKLGLSESMLYALIKNMSDAIRYLTYEKHTVHRDIKPKNILFDENKERFILADFGLAKSFDPSTFTYRSCPGGTEDYVHPMLFHKETVDISVNTELWPMAVTFFRAATGRHPYVTRTRFKGLELMKAKTDEVFWIDEKEEYRSDFKIFIRPSETFCTTFLSPLLLEMMSSKADMKNYFDLIENLRLAKEKILHILDVSRFEFFQVTRSNTTFGATIENCVSYDLDKITACHRKSEVNRDSSVPKTSREHPIVMFSLERKLQDVLNRINRELFREVEWETMTTGQSMTVFEITALKFKMYSEHVKLIRDLAQTICQQKEREKIKLRAKWEVFLVELDHLSTITKPSDDFERFLDTVAKDIVETNVVDPLSSISFTELLTLDQVVTFLNCLSVLKQDKLKKTRKAHLRHVQIAMDISVKAVTLEICKIMEMLFAWIQDINNYDMKLRTLLAQIDFVLKTLNDELINKINSIV